MQNFTLKYNLIIACLFFIFLFACTQQINQRSRQELPINKTEIIANQSSGDQMKEYDSMASFLAENNLAFKQLKINVDGDNINSEYGNLACVYYELCRGYYSNESKNDPNNPSKRDNHYASEKPFYIIIEGKYKINVSPDSTLRLFLLPTFEEKFDKQNGSEDEKGSLDKDKTLIFGRRMVYCLQKNKTYYLYIKKESVSYGAPIPPRPGMPSGGGRASKIIYFLQISDKEFVDGKSQVKATPTFKGWIYG